MESAATMTTLASTMTESELPQNVIDENRAWTRKCIKQADIILILMDGKEKRDTEVTDIEKRVNLFAPRARKELILVHGCRHPEGTCSKIIFNMNQSLNIFEFDIFQHLHYIMHT